MEPDNYYDHDPDNNDGSSQRATIHTQFLDLTNGTGGESMAADLSMTYNDDDDYNRIFNNNNDNNNNNNDMSGNTGSTDRNSNIPGPTFPLMNTSTMQHSTMSLPDVCSGGTVGVNANANANANTNANATVSGVKLGTHVPGGRVVVTGHESTGRWTKEEHDAFLNALKMYGKEWKKVAAKVKTRTVVQTRTHAQKYFQKLSKATEGKEGASQVDMGTASDSRSRGGSASKKKQRTTSTLMTTSMTTPPNMSRTASVASAAQVMSTLSGQRHHNNTGTSLPPLFFGRPLEASTIERPACRSQTDNSTVEGLLDPSPPKSHNFQTSAAAVGTMSNNNPESSMFQPTHGFSSSFATTTSTINLEPTKPAASTTISSTIGTNGFPRMKILAPDHDSAFKKGKFPEPSPAACGKRKLAEIAAARMLAGVAASESLLPPSSQSLSPENRNTTTHQSLKNSFSGIAAVDMDHRDHDNPLVNIEDGTATPPPEEENNNIAAQSSRTVAHAGFEMFKVPSVTTGFNTNTTTPRKPMGLSLQIVNPESLGFSHEELEGRKKDGNMSPVTPWEGQLQALVSEEKRKEPAQEATTKGFPIAPEISGVPNMYINSSLHHICGPGSAFGRSMLHKSVCDMDIFTLQSQLSSRPDCFDRRDEKGYCPIHSACSLCLKDPMNSTVTAEIVRMLIAAGVDASIRDLDGNTPLHWAARAGDKATVEFLLVKNNPKDAKNERGETPLHWAMRSGRLGIPVASILLENGARPSVWNTDFKRPIDVAADGFFDESDPVMELIALDEKKKKLKKEQRQKLREAAEERKEARANLFNCSSQSRTLVLYHPECLEHIQKAEGDWENPNRIISIMERIQGNYDNSGSPSIYPREIQVSQEFERAKLDLLSRVHSTEYLNFVNELSKDLERQHKAQNGSNGGNSDDNGGTPPVVPFTPMVQRSMIKVQDSKIKIGEHSDTSFSGGSLRAARRAAGAVQHAVDCVLVGRHRNAFCIVRPPGHHAGINGLLDGGESCGFCIFNSVAAGAMHAISNERLMCERCAIVDFDAHHGNGTEEIVRKCHDPGKLFFFSIHLYDNDTKGKRETKAFQYKFYPGTGDEDDLPLNIINVPIAPLWKEENQPPVHREHNTRHRTRTRGNQSDDGSSSETGTPRRSDAEVELKIRSRASSPVPSNTGVPRGRIAYRHSIQNRLLPALRAFNPDLILISAGFDASKGDVGNAKHEAGGKEKMGIDLEPEDYAWTTSKILEIADICCQGRVVSVLEGGYGRHNTSGVHDSTEPLDKSLFGECAIRHAHAMIDPYNAEERFGSSGKSKR